jgi:carbonic anhydrase/acetyltransferase-like protein (isoleucine patch superfamily)
MEYMHRSLRPRIDPSAVIAPTAVIAGDVTIGPGCHVGFGAVLVAEGAAIQLGTSVIVREHALLRSTSTHPLHVGSYVLIGPRACLYGCTIEDEVFLATGATIFHGAHLGVGSEVRINGVVHVSTELPRDSTVPIGWIAVGHPVRILPPDAHDEVWAIQESLNFPKVVYGLDRRADGRIDMRELTRRVYEAGSAHAHDRCLPDGL